MRGQYNTPKRSHVIKTRLDDDEYEFFLRKCQVYGMNQSEMIRASLDKLVINPVIKFSPVNKELLSKIDELIATGNRIGNNLNQIARAINSGYPDQPLLSRSTLVIGNPQIAWRLSGMEIRNLTGGGQRHWQRSNI